MQICAKVYLCSFCKSKFYFIKARDYYELPNSNGIYKEDDVLIGLISLALATLKHQQTCYITTTQHQSNNNKLELTLITKPCIVFMNELFDYLFKITNKSEALNNQQMLQLPKCRAVQTRALCFDLLIELCRSNLENYKFLNQTLIQLHKTLTITMAAFTPSTSLFFLHSF